MILWLLKNDSCDTGRGCITDLKDSSVLFINKPLFTARKARRKNKQKQNSSLGKNNLEQQHITCQVTSRQNYLWALIVESLVLWFNSNVRTNVRSNNILSILPFTSMIRGGGLTYAVNIHWQSSYNCHYVDLALFITYDCVPPYLSLVCTPCSQLRVCQILSSKKQDEVFCAPTVWLKMRETAERLLRDSCEDSLKIMKIEWRIHIVTSWVPSRSYKLDPHPELIIKLRINCQWFG